jgi:hypothetical protein
MSPKVKSWTDAGDTPYRQNHREEAKFDPSTPLACAEHLHFTLNGETRRAPGPLPDNSTQTTGEDADHKVS